MKDIFVQKEELNAYQKTIDADKKYAGLDETGKIPESQIPDKALKDTTYNAASTTESGLLTSENFKKLKDIESGAQANKIETIKKNGVIIPINSKVVDIKVPVKVSELNNDSNYITTNDLETKLSNLNAVTYNYMNELPTTGEKNIIYIVPSAKSGDKNVKTEWLWTGTEWEKFGEFKSDVDLTGVWAKNELEFATDEEVRNRLNLTV